MTVKCKRVYEPAEQQDGYRVLVDGIWPRGMSRDRLQLDDWVRELAPSASLRRWFGHDPERWSEFRRRYLEELEPPPDALKDLARRAARGRVTLLYAARETRYNHARVLAEYLSDTDTARD
jgi:uncharacterized protein YeaO (DUF488 family)